MIDTNTISEFASTRSFLLFLIAFPMQPNFYNLIMEIKLTAVSIYVSICFYKNTLKTHEEYTNKHLPFQCCRRGRRGWRCGCSSSWMDGGHLPWQQNWGHGQSMKRMTVVVDKTPCLERPMRWACTCCCQAVAAGDMVDLGRHTSKQSLSQWKAVCTNPGLANYQHCRPKSVSRMSDSEPFHAPQCIRTLTANMSLAWKLFTVSDEPKYAKVNCGVTTTTTNVWTKLIRHLTHPQPSSNIEGQLKMRKGLMPCYDFGWCGLVLRRVIISGSVLA